MSGRQLRARLHDALEHRGAIAHDLLHALAEIQRDIHRHHVVVDRVLVDEQHLRAGAGRLDGRRHSGHAGAHDHHADAPFGPRSLVGDGAPIDRRRHR